MPTPANARMAGITFEEYEKQVIKALDIDYGRLQEECEKKVDEYKNPRRIIKTGKDCVLEMDLTGREWYIDAGDG